MVTPRQAIGALKAFFKGPLRSERRLRVWTRTLPTLGRAGLPDLSRWGDAAVDEAQKFVLKVRHQYPADEEAARAAVECMLPGAGGGETRSPGPQTAPRSTVTRSQLSSTIEQAKNLLLNPTRSMASELGALRRSVGPRRDEWDARVFALVPHAGYVAFWGNEVNTDGDNAEPALPYDWCGNRIDEETMDEDAITNYLSDEPQMPQDLAPWRNAYEALYKAGDLPSVLASLRVAAAEGETSPGLCSLLVHLYQAVESIGWYFVNADATVKIKMLSARPDDKSTPQSDDLSANTRTLTSRTLAEWYDDPWFTTLGRTVHEYAQSQGWKFPTREQVYAAMQAHGFCDAKQSAHLNLDWIVRSMVSTD